MGHLRCCGLSVNKVRDGEGLVKDTLWICGGSVGGVFVESTDARYGCGLVDERWAGTVNRTGEEEGA